MNANFALDTALGTEGGDFHAHLDIITHLRDLLRKPKKGELPVYLGLGAKIRDDKNTVFGIRFLGGLSYLFERHPLEAFAEIAPVLRCAPSFQTDLDFGIGLRYYFKK